MRAAVLISAGLHRVSGRPAPVGVEMQAVRLALGLGAEAAGLHAGPEWPALRDGLGHGLSRMLHLRQEAGDDPLPALVTALLGVPPDIVLCGRRGQGGTDSGMLPYGLAAALGWPLLPDVVGLRRVAAGVEAEQAGLRGARRRTVARLPCVVTVHPAAPPARPFAHVLARGPVEVRRMPPGVPGEAFEERPRRARPRLLVAADAAAKGGRVLAALPPEEAAAEILAHLRRIGVLAPSRREAIAESG